MNSAADWPPTAIQRRLESVRRRTRPRIAAAGVAVKLLILAPSVSLTRADFASFARAILPLSNARRAFNRGAQNGSMRRISVILIPVLLVLALLLGITLWRVSDALPGLGRIVETGTAANRRAVHADRPGRQAAVLRGVPRPLHADLFRLFHLPGRLPDDAGADGRCAGEGRAGARPLRADLHHGRSGTRYAGAAQILSQGVRAGFRRADRRSEGDNQGRGRLPRLFQEARAAGRRLFDGSFQRDLSDGSRRAASSPIGTTPRSDRTSSPRNCARGFRAFRIHFSRSVIARLVRAIQFGNRKKIGSPA